jgi:hypothetical protein
MLPNATIFSILVTGKRNSQIGQRVGVGLLRTCGCNRPIQLSNQINEMEFLFFLIHGVYKLYYHIPKGKQILWVGLLRPLFKQGTE